MNQSTKNQAANEPNIEPAADLAGQADALAHSVVMLRFLEASAWAMAAQVDVLHQTRQVSDAGRADLYRLCELKARIAGGLVRQIDALTLGQQQRTAPWALAWLAGAHRLVLGLKARMRGAVLRLAIAGRLSWPRALRVMQLLEPAAAAPPAGAHRAPVAHESMP